MRTKPTLMLPYVIRFLLSFAFLLLAIPAESYSKPQNILFRKPLKIMTFGGSFHEAQRLSLFLPFSTLYPSPKLSISFWSGQLKTLQDIIVYGKNDADLVVMDESDITIACLRGILLPTPSIPDSSHHGRSVPSASPISADTNAIHSSCIIKNTLTPLHIVLSWDTRRFHKQPDWRDFWDISRNPGRRGLHKDVKGTMEIALLADNVAPEDVYAVLSTATGVRRAFHKLNQIKPYISWWSSYTEAITLLREGQVLMTSAAAEEVESYNINNKQALGIQNKESLTTNLAWSVTMPYDRPLTPGLETFVSFISAPRQQNLFSKLFNYSNASKLTDSMNGAATKHEHGSKKPLPQFFQIDPVFWQSHYADLQKRFTIWLNSP